ncbi:energy transducer TonB [candidate division KSB1 bacterium]|nr:energy transducer TonB [candidate division KSB1 bacterium]
MLIKKEPKANLKLKYKKVLEVGLILSLLAIIALVMAFKRFETKSIEQQMVQLKIEVQEIPKTEQQKQAAAPSRPSIPVETESEDIAEDETIDETELNWEDQLPPPPPPPQEDEEDESSQIFVAYDEPPEPIGGFGAIQTNLKYPEIARKAGVEGKVYVKVLVNERGDVVRTEILKSLGNNGCDEAAVEAIRKARWKPAMQRDRPVKVWISIPVIFKLK